MSPKFFTLLIKISSSVNSMVTSFKAVTYNFSEPLNFKQSSEASVVLSTT